ncbi:MAG TPA: hypothetical protein VIG32_12040 [Candidatus Baltobacteraceae bacterium]
MIVRRLMLIAVLSSITLASCYAAAGARYRVAPADEYFGHMKMSILEIGNRLRDVSNNEDRRARPADSILHDTLLTEDAIHDWEHKYPADPWLARDVARLVHIYARLQTPASMGRMHRCMSWLSYRYKSRRALIAAERVEVAIADSHVNARIRR